MYVLYEFEEHLTSHFISRAQMPYPSANHCLGKEDSLGLRGLSAKSDVV